MSAAPGPPVPDRTCPMCGAPARYLAIPHPAGEGTTIPLPPGAFGGKWYHDSVPGAPAAARIAPTDAMIEAAREAMASHPACAREGIVLLPEVVELGLRAALAAAEAP